MIISDFTYTSYLHLLKLIAKNGYTITGYHKYSEAAYPCILRHDIDNDVEKALELAKLEADNSVQSTYFILLNTNFYNVFSSTVNKTLKEMTNNSLLMFICKTKYFQKTIPNSLFQFYCQDPGY
ncbi:hypothetical protein AGMMS49944_18610 [Spirochaetia bacterium]|nr:hypothetical protein AGMMS49944_18610 [Spirochaetia bacterium]